MTGGSHCHKAPGKTRPGSDRVVNGVGDKIWPGTTVRSMNSVRLLLLALVLPLFQACTTAEAATYAGTFAVTMTVAPACSISASTMAFGIYTGTVVNTTTPLSVTCTNTTAYQIGADNGQNSVFIGVYAKYMLGPSSSKLRYHLYTDAARTIEWGTTAGTNEVAGTGTGAPQAITVYGTIGLGSYASVPGSYSDIVTFTLTF
jgi:spore coat protein U-like protein